MEKSGKLLLCLVGFAVIAGIVFFAILVSRFDSSAEKEKIEKMFSNINGMEELRDDSEVDSVVLDYLSEGKGRVTFKFGSPNNVVFDGTECRNVMGVDGKTLRLAAEYDKVMFGQELVVTLAKIPESIVVNGTSVVGIEGAVTDNLSIEFGNRLRLDSCEIGSLDLVVTKQNVNQISGNSEIGIMNLLTTGNVEVGEEIVMDSIHVETPSGDYGKMCMLFIKGKRPTISLIATDYPISVVFVSPAFIPGEVIKTKE